MAAGSYFYIIHLYAANTMLHSMLQTLSKEYLEYDTSSTAPELTGGQHRNNKTLLQSLSLTWTHATAAFLVTAQTTNLLQPTDRDFRLSVTLNWEI